MYIAKKLVQRGRLSLNTSFLGFVVVLAAFRYLATLISSYPIPASLLSVKFLNAPN